MAPPLAVTTVAAVMLQRRSFRFEQVQFAPKHLLPFQTQVQQSTGCEVGACANQQQQLQQQQRELNPPSSSSSSSSSLATVEATAFWEKKDSPQSLVRTRRRLKPATLISERQHKIRAEFQCEHLSQADKKTKTNKWWYR